MNSAAVLVLRDVASVNSALIDSATGASVNAVAVLVFFGGGIG
jgi:hypothetical protein